eukprot:TRINITY_DN9497_c0_g1_i2.p1 TRINITY_DN9497_c0_g1~~TRINITY_DN9497_c0_g1_i2.p1  ORF type:complete len:472 (-),score=51.24 TRINITY_DN9497_c0_g1_i2:259-1674(-)
MLLHFVLNNKKGPKQKKLGKRAKKYAKDPARQFMNHWRSDADGQASETQSYVTHPAVQAQTPGMPAGTPVNANDQPFVFQGNPGHQGSSDVRVAMGQPGHAATGSQDGVATYGADAMQAAYPGAQAVPMGQVQGGMMPVMAVLVPHYNYPVPTLPVNPEDPRTAQAAATGEGQVGGGAGQGMAPPQWPVPVNYILMPQAQQVQGGVAGGQDDTKLGTPPIKGEKSPSPGASMSDVVKRNMDPLSDATVDNESGGGIVHSPEETDQFVADIDEMLGNDIPDIHRVSSVKPESGREEETAGDGGAAAAVCPTEDFDETFSPENDDSDDQPELLSICFTSDDAGERALGLDGNSVRAMDLARISAGGRLDGDSLTNLGQLGSPSQMDVSRLLEITHYGQESTGMAPVEDQFYGRQFSPMIARAISQVSPILGREIKELSPAAAHALNHRSPALARAMNYHASQNQQSIHSGSSG